MAVLTLSWILDVVVVILSAFFAAFLYMTRNFNYWTKKGVAGPRPIPFVGNFSAYAFLRKAAGHVIEDLYFAHKGQDRVGFYIFDKPCLLVRDLDLAKRILVKDSNFFGDRHASAGDNDPLGSANLFLIKNPHWKTLRAKLSPTMSSGKLKKMFQLMVAVGRDLDTHLKSLELEGDGRVVELNETWARYTTDIIATCAYGLRANCLNDPDSEFRKYGKRIFKYNFKRAVEIAAIFFIPGIIKPLDAMFFEKSSSEFLRKVFWDTLTQRMKSGNSRNDLIDTLIELKKAQAQADIDDPNLFKFDGDNLTAQAAIYFTGGFDTTASTLSFAIYEMALHQDVQSRLREEISSALEDNGGDLHYEWVDILNALMLWCMFCYKVTQLPYLDMVISETLRKYPIVPFLNRVAASDYKVPGSDLVIEKGTPVYVSSSGIQKDPEYFPNPDEFDPERFNSENKQKRPSHAYMPFGLGPRNCIGSRFGLLSIKICLVKTIPYYKFTTCQNTIIPIRINPKAVVTALQDELFLNVREITTGPR